jgi:cytochrome c oxidase subunit 2
MIRSRLASAIALGASLACGCHGANADRTAPNAVSPAPVAASATVARVENRAEHVVRISAKRFEYSPSKVELKKGETVVLELTSLDRVHGFNAPDFGLRADVKPGETARVRFVPDKVGTFAFHCDVFCGDGHEEMNGEIVVSE